MFMQKVFIRALMLVFGFASAGASSDIPEDIQEIMRQQRTQQVINGCGQTLCDIANGRYVSDEKYKIVQPFIEGFIDHQLDYFPALNDLGRFLLQNQKVDIYETIFTRPVQGDGAVQPDWARNVLGLPEDIKAQILAEGFYDNLMKLAFGVHYHDVAMQIVKVKHDKTLRTNTSYKKWERILCHKMTR